MGRRCNHTNPRCLLFFCVLCATSAPSASSASSASCPRIDTQKRKKRKNSAKYAKNTQTTFLVFLLRLLRNFCAFCVLPPHSRSMRQSTRKRCAAWVTACSLSHPTKLEPNAKNAKTPQNTLKTPKQYFRYFFCDFCVTSAPSASCPRISAPHSLYPAWQLEAAVTSAQCVRRIRAGR